MPLPSTPCLSSAKETQSYLRQGTEVPWQLQRPRLHGKDSLVHFHGTENEVRPEVWGTAEPPVLGFGFCLIKSNRTRVIDLHLKIARLSYTWCCSCQITLVTNLSFLGKAHWSGPLSQADCHHGVGSKSSPLNLLVTVYLLLLLTTSFPNRTKFPERERHRHCCHTSDNIQKNAVYEVDANYVLFSERGDENLPSSVSDVSWGRHPVFVLTASTVPNLR